MQKQWKQKAVETEAAQRASESAVQRNGDRGLAKGALALEMLK